MNQNNPHKSSGRLALSQAWKIALGCLAAVVLVVALIFVTGGISRGTADFRGGTEVKERTVSDGKYRIASYEHFYDLNASVEALNKQICTMQSTNSLPASQRETNILALTNQRIAAVEQYNADVQKAETLGQYKANDLPYQLTQETPSC